MSAGEAGEENEHCRLCVYEKLTSKALSTDRSAATTATRFTSKPCSLAPTRARLRSSIESPPSSTLIPSSTQHVKLNPRKTKRGATHHRPLPTQGKRGTAHTAPWHSRAKRQRATQSDAVHPHPPAPSNTPPKPPAPLPLTPERR